MTQMQPVNIAIVGATGLVGEAMRELLEARDFPVGRLHLLASARSAGETLLFRGKPVQVEDLAGFDFRQVRLCLFSAGGAVSADYAPKALAAGCLVIDNTSHFRRDPDIPLVVPEINPHRVRREGIIANPNCSTIQMLLALAPIRQAAGLKRINVATYQAVSGAGRRAVEELAGQTASLLNAQGADASVFPRQIAFNALPEIGGVQENGYTLEEMKMVWETRKIFEDDAIAVNPTCVRIPVFYGHAEALHVETREKLGAAEAQRLLAKAPGVSLMDEPAVHRWPTPALDAAGADAVFVGRVREDLSCEKGLNLWVVSDNVRKGAALNTIQIAELLLKKGL